MSYFDYNATTPLSPAARDAWLEAESIAWQNPSAPYRSGARVHNLLEKARARLAARIGCEPGRIVFNSGATEGVNSVFQYASSNAAGNQTSVLLSPFEHPCVVASAKRYFPGNAVQLTAGRDGRCDPAEAKARLQERPFALLAIMAANNETGVLQPWAEIAEAARTAGVPVLCDASQWAGKRPLHGLAEAGFVTASAHKFGGPKGCGFLVVPKSAADYRGFAGGEQEHGMRAGTENYPAVAAMLAALEECEDRAADKTLIAERLQWRREFERQITRRIPEARIAGGESERLWNTVFLVLPRGANDRWVRKLDREGIEVSTGSACSWGKDEPSHVLTAIGFSRDESRRAIRISSGWETCREDWLELAEALVKIDREIAGSTGNAGVIQLESKPSRNAPH